MKPPCTTTPSFAAPLLVLAAPALALAQTEAVQVDVLFAADATSGDDFGERVALRGANLAVAAPDRNEPGLGDAGQVYVYGLGASGWALEATLLASDNGANDKFGQGMALGDSGPFPVIAAGSPGWDDPFTWFDKGALYLFEETLSGWNEVAFFSPADLKGGDGFGDQLATDGRTVVAGANNHDSAGSNAGAVYVFEDQGLNWAQTAKLTASDAGSFRFFGSSVGVDGDVLAAGSIADPTNGNFAGAAYVFEKVGPAWVEVAKLIGSSVSSGDQFGKAIAVSGDVIVVGAPFDTTATASSAGSATVYRKQGAVWVEEAILEPTSSDTSQVFGWSVDVDGDWIVVGAYGSDVAGENSGAMHLFEYEGGAWHARGKYAGVTPNNMDDTGLSVSLDGGRIAAGAPGEDDVDFDVGAVVVSHRTLIGSQRQLSAAAGGTVQFDLNAGAGLGGDLYLLLGSLSGTAPGLVVAGLTLPLNFDGYLDFTLANPNAAPLTDSFGVLDPEGAAVASFGVTPGGLAPLIGSTIHHAWVGVDALTATANFTSAAEPVSVAP